MNTNDLYLEYARVIQMCKGTELEDTPWVCVKLDGEALRDNYGHPGFSASIEKYEFAVAVLEGKPVFCGDRIYAKSPNYDMLNGAIVTRTVHGNLVAQFDDGTQIQIYGFENGLETYFTWTPPPPTPKRTFTLNGVELPCPIANTVKRAKPRLVINNVSFFFDLFGDAEKVRNEIINLLTEARDKP